MNRRRDSGIFSSTGDPDELEVEQDSDEENESALEDVLRAMNLAQYEEGGLRDQWNSSDFLDDIVDSDGDSTPVSFSPRSSTPPAKWWKQEGSGRFYRSTSLRSALKSSSGPKNRKVVRFADALGLDLEQTRHIQAKGDSDKDKLQFAPDMDFVRDERGRTERTKPASSKPTQGDDKKFLVPYFTLPSGYNTEKLLRSQHVCLESISVSGLSVTGVVRVTNLGFDKQVHVRYSLDNWKTESEIRASFIPGSSDGFTDKFVFTLFLPQNLPVFSFCQFAIRYKGINWEYWDNFHKKNYTLECRKERSLGQNPLDSGWAHLL